MIPHSLNMHLALALIILHLWMVDVQALDEVRLSVSLYDTVRLPCSFWFIESQRRLKVVWERMDGAGRRFFTHKLTDGRDDLRDQDQQYAGRTELATDLSLKSLDLTLRNVTYSDEGTYFCRAANDRGHGDKKVTLSIDKLNAEDPMVTVVPTKVGKCLKCVDTGRFGNPWVRWFGSDGTELSEYGRQNITVLSDGRKRVESVLERIVERNRQYICQIKEGRLKKACRAVISDGVHPVTITKIQLPE